MRRAVRAGLVFGMCLTPLLANAQNRVNPYECEGIAQDLGSRLSLAELKAEADSRAKLGEQLRTKEPVRASMLFCTAAELYKRLGHPKAGRMYADAIATNPGEPALELFWSKYLMVYRGAGMRPLFPSAESHFSAAVAKLSALSVREGWDRTTEDRIRRTRIALYERDGVPLAERSRAQLPWLSFSPSFRYEMSTSDVDRTSDVRDRTSEAAFRGSRFRLGRTLNAQEQADLTRLQTPLETGGRIRARYASLPVVDVSATGRRTGDAQVTNFYEPSTFNDLRLTDIGVGLTEPFAISGNADGLAQFSYHRINRKGLVEFAPDVEERLDQYVAAGAFSQYVGPDRFNVSYSYIHQRIDASPDRPPRDRQFTGGTVAYQIFRPVPLRGRAVEMGPGRYFETRGIEVSAGILNDDEHFTSTSTDVVVSRRDLFAGISVRGVKSVDITVQPTWFTSRVSNDPTQDNGQLRTQGNILIRVLDEERSAGIPRERLFGLPVAFVHVVVPFHWDSTRFGLESFPSRRLGTELWVKSFGKEGSLTALSIAGYSRQWFPALGRHVDLFRVGFSLGF